MSTTAKNILLFSDGTGNSSGKLQKTNVWRLYEALDLGLPSEVTSPVQIAYYDNGVGTSGGKIIAAITGVFGYGLARNVREIYKFLCRNYVSGDRLYAVGFSRGAFTIRLLVALIASKGIITYESEGDLDLQVRDVWREFRRESLTNNPFSAWLVIRARAIVRGLIATKRTVFRQRGYAAALSDGATCYSPDLEFVGVWDTVAAYGGPIVELTRAIDELIWPLTMSNYHLSEKVKCARHALSIDDKRDAFTPLPWDEVHENALIEQGKVKAGRLQQVWFAGMHADVGGGYADESLSYVSLTWMIDHAKLAGMRLLPALEDRIRTMANIFGPLHDSRSGAGAFYRYQPRFIGAWLNPPPPATQVYRDPSIGGSASGSQGLLNDPIRIHHSVEARLKAGTDGYSPVNLPNTHIVDNGPQVPAGPLHSVGANSNHLAEIGDLIAGRRTWYFVSFWLVVALLSKPFWPEALRNRSLLGYFPFAEQADARNATFPLEAAANAFLPDFVHMWTRSFASAPFTFLTFIIFILIAFARGNSLESKMAGISRAVWKAHFSNVALPTAYIHQPARWLRRNEMLQWALGKWKWRVVPFAVGVMLFLAVAYIANASLVQFALAWTEEHKTCGMSPTLLQDGLPKGQEIEPGNVYPAKYDLTSPCQDLALNVEEGHTYHISLTTVDWKDDETGATPIGWTPSWLNTIKSAAFAPLRRVTGAPFFAPLVEVRDVPYSGLVDIERPILKHDGGKWTGDFTPKRDGRLFFFVNDAFLLYDPGDGNWGCLSKLFSSDNWFNLAGRYGNNHGTSQIEIWEGDRPIVPSAPTK